MAQEYVDSIYPIFHELNNFQVPDLLSHEVDISRSKNKFCKGTLFLININEEGRNALKIDDVLSLYLIDIADQVIVNFYKMSCCFIQLLRNCINEYAFEVLSGIQPIESPKDKTQITSSFNSALGLIELIETHQKSLYTQRAHKYNNQSNNNKKEQNQQKHGDTSLPSALNNNIDIIPHISNIFLQRFIPQKCNVFSISHAVGLMRHLIEWLSNRRFTTYQIKLNEDKFKNPK